MSHVTVRLGCRKAPAEIWFHCERISGGCARQISILGVLIVNFNILICILLLQTSLYFQLIRLGTR